jgi:hypothetical protein
MRATVCRYFCPLPSASPAVGCLDLTAKRPGLIRMTGNGHFNRYKLLGGVDISGICKRPREQAATKRLKLHGSTRLLTIQRREASRHVGPTTYKCRGIDRTRCSGASPSGHTSLIAGHPSTHPVLDTQNRSEIARSFFNLQSRDRMSHEP